MPLAWLFMALMLLSSTACSTLTSTAGITVDAAQGLALLPINNLSETPQADAQAQILVETQLRARGVQRLGTYEQAQHVSLRALLDPARQLSDGMQWATQSGYRYGLTGTVNEWHYKAGADKEPVVGMNLKLLDLFSGEVLWQANAARTGWGYASLPAVADALIAELLQGIRFEER
jgi:hypothetical protein